MLSINTNLHSHSDHKEHAWALRTIGQDLADLWPEYLEIEFTGQLYIARGRAQTIEADSNKRVGGKVLGKLSRPGKRRNGQRRESSWFERSYPLHEIHRLDNHGSIQRKNYPNGPDIYILGERLRTAGKMIEAKDGQLVKLTLDNYRVTFTFRDSTGAIHNEEHSTPALYRSQQDNNLLRGSGTTRDPWRFAAPRDATRGAALLKGQFKLMSDRASKRSARRDDDER